MKENYSDKSTWRRKYIGIRKMRWDMLWHVLFEKNGEESWNRVSKEEALTVVEQL